MTNFAITKPFFTQADIDKIDPRFLKFLKGWRIEEIYENNTVIIPRFDIYNYFEFTDNPQEMEKQLSIWCGWDKVENGVVTGLEDAEVEINLRLENDAIANNIDSVHGEITKHGDAPMKVFFNNKLVTDFTETITVTCPGSWFYPPKIMTYSATNGYQTRLMNQFL